VFTQKAYRPQKKTVDKLMMNNRSDISVELEDMENASQTEKQAVVDLLTADVFKSMKPKRCTHEFSTPEIAIEALEMMVKDKVNYSHLTIMKKRTKLNAEGNPKISKATKKPLMEWVPLHEEEQAKEAA